MALSFLVLFLTVGGSLVSGFEICGPQVRKCTEEMNELFLDGEPRDWFPPSPALLNTMCSPGMRMLECMADGAKECTGKTLAELAALENNPIAIGAQWLLDTTAIAVEICDKDSALHKGYMNNIECFKGMVEDAEDECRQQARDLHRAYRESLELVGDEEDADILNDEAQCLTVSYGIACITFKVQETCGEEARQTFMEIVKRIHPMTRHLCSEEDFVDAKNKFIDFLAYEGEKKDQFSEAFKLGKRK